MSTASHQSSASSLLRHFFSNEMEDRCTAPASETSERFGSGGGAAVDRAAIALRDLRSWSRLTLSREQRLIIMLRFAEQLAVHEIAELLHLTESVVEGELVRVRSMVRDRLASAGMM